MITPVERFILFALGEFFEQTSKKLSGKPLELSISKAEFIAIARKANLTPKKERALYKNLESLEAKKLLHYEEKNLRLTEKGQKAFTKIRFGIEPYLNMQEILASEEPLKYARRAQTIFSKKL